MALAATDLNGSLSIVNHPPTRLPGPGLLDLFVQTVSQNGQPAVDFLRAHGSRTSLSYTELHHAADSLASRILALAGPPEGSKPFVVPVLIPQSPELYITLLAILKAGGAFCPMNLDVPPERAKFILEDIGAQIVITTSDLASRLGQGGQSVVLIVDSEAPHDEPDAVTPHHRQPTPTDLAYVMYTSGSTGTPKGVGISHDAATQSLLAHDRHIPHFSRFLQFAAPTFDVSVFEIFFPLFRGKTLVSCTRTTMLNDLPGVLCEMEVDACELTPSVAGSLLRRRESAPSLRLLLTIGEMLTQPVIEEFGGGDARPSMLWGMYGPTEAAIHCTMQPAFKHDSPIGDIGVPLDTVSGFIIKIPEEEDPSSGLEVLPRGEIGELAVGGHQLAEGYLNRPELTSEVFVDTPYGRLYRTGDKARMRDDGTIECFGRITQGQVKLRGQRMELGEVEHAALRTPGCHSAVAAVVESTLVLFCAVDDRVADMEMAVMQSCRQWLPGFMLPGDIIVTRSFPRLASGKVDRKGMVVDYKARTAGASSKGMSYKDELQEQLCNIAAASLGIQVHPDQDLLKAGLDSLSAIKLASALREAGFDVGAVDVLEIRTIPALRSRLRSVCQVQPSDMLSAPATLDLDISNIMASHPVLSKLGRSIETVLSCTPLQASMLAETMADPRAYCNWVELSAPSTYSQSTIRSWFLQLAQANEVLRTGFTHHEGQFMQVVFDAFDESSLSSTDSVTGDFSMSDEMDYLRPFRVHIIAPSSENDTTTIVLQLHHAVYDGWSLDLILSDLAALTRGQRLEPRPQFRQVCAFHQSAAFKRACDAAREFWADNLLGFQTPAPPILSSEIIGSSKVMTTTSSFDYIPEDAKLALQRIDCGTQTIFQAALAWLWSSMVGNEDVVVGSIQSGRTVPIAKIEDVLGPCIASEPLRTDLSQVRTIRDLLVSVHAANRASLRHSALPLSEIKRAAGIRSGQAIYDVLFVYQESLHSKDQGSHVFKQVAHQDYLETRLLVEVEPRGDSFECRFTYHSNTFPEAQVGVMADSLRALVLYMLQHVNSELPSVAQAFSQELLSIFNPNPTTFSGVPDLATAVEQMAAQYPGKDAVCFADYISDGVLTTTTITFAALDNTASQIAWHLGHQGVQEGGVVAILMEKSIRLYAGILAILKTGCAYLPLQPSTPAARVNAVLQQAGVTFCLVDTHTREKLRQSVSCNLIDLQTLDLRSTNTLTTRPKPDPDRLAYIIYTSGSTGVPKGVCLTQINIMSNLDVLSRIYPVKEDSRLLQSCSQAFDVSVFEIFFAWTRGMCLCSATNDTLFEDLERSIRKLNVTHLSMTPTVASLVDPDKVPRVEFLVTAGEPMTEVVARKWGDKVYQGYGPSETTNICSVKKMGPSQAIQHLGWSFENTSTFVLARESMEAVPFGCLGELCFGGDQVAQGYLGMEELTAAKFINHSKFGRLYRSGDLGRMLPDGSMVIVGRADDQIKIRGQRVELNEINEAIRRSSDVVDCVTLHLCADQAGGRDQLIAFFVPERYETMQFEVLQPDDNITREIRSLYRALDSRLASYMVPSAIVPISVLPTTASGKLDRIRLKQTFQDLGSDHLELVSHGAELDTDQGEWSDVEIQVAEAIQVALNVSRDDIRRWTPLNSLGLDSISAIQVSRQLQQQLHTRFPISLILQNPSVARLAQTLPQLDVSNAQPEQAEIPELLPQPIAEKVGRRLVQHRKQPPKVLPCTPLQEAMLATSDGKAQYLNRMLLQLNGNVSRIKDSWSDMVIRHDILRTCFLSTDDASWPIVQAVLDQWQAPWHNFNASQTGLEDCLSRHAQALPDPIDSVEPAVSFAAIKRGDDVFLSFICHHALYDGVAIERLLFEVEQHVSGFSLPPVPAYDHFLQKALTLPASTDSFWRRYLDGYQPKMTTHLSSKLTDTKSRSAAELDIPLSQVQTQIKVLGVSLLALTQSAWALALVCLVRTDDICFGNVVNGRSLAIEGINELVAPCFNTIPVRMDLSRRQRNLDLMKAFQAANAELMEYQFTPLRRIQSLFSEHGTRRLFDTLLLLQQSPRVLDRSVWTLERDDGEMDVPLVCEVIPDSNVDRIFVRMHGIESQPLPHGILKLVLDLFSHALKNCLQFPASHWSLDGIACELVERLSGVEHQPPKMALETSVQQVATTEEWTTVEESIRSVLATLSPTVSHRIGRSTSLYQLGFDSISAVQIALMLRERGHQVVASDVIQHPTCESLGRYLERRAIDSGVTSEYDLSPFQSQVQPQISALGIALDLVEAVLPCTPLQSAMMAQFIKSCGRDYFNFIDFELADGVDHAKLADAWQAVSLAHPLLRTGFVPVEHEDCAFSMVQYNAIKFVPVLAVLCGEQAEAFDLGSWRVAAVQAASQAPYSQLWTVAVVKAAQNATMHLAIHHALYDAYYLQVILDDLSRAAVGGALDLRPATPETVADILGQVSSAAESSAGFWKNQADKVVVNGFPVMTPLRQASRSILTESARSTAALSTLEEAASRSGHTLQVILQAAWTRVLSAYLGEQSVVFGVVLSGRNTEATRNASFPCISTLPVIATNVASNQILLGQMLQYNAELYKQQHQPLTRIHQWLGYPDARLFDTLLVYQKLNQETLEERPWRVVNESANVDYPVSIEIEPQPRDQLGYRITFFSDVLGMEQAYLLLKQFGATVQQLAHNPNGQEADLLSLSPKLFSVLPPELPEILTPVQFLHQFVELQALRVPDNTALYFVDMFNHDEPVGRKWSYKELDENGNRVAQMLLPHANPGNIVAVYFDKSPEAYFSILGILKAGCAFLALDPGAPLSRNEFILQDSGASVLVTSKQRKDSKELNVDVPVVGIDEGSLAAISADPPVLTREITTNDVCYCLYTSGTTGTPKGCEITHDNAVQCMLAFQHIFEGHWQDNSRWLQFASLHFDVSVLEQYWSWSVGITLVAAPRDLILEDLAGTISCLEITHIDLTPSLARMLHPDDVPSLCRGVFITGGEALKQEILDVWGCKEVIYNFYGPTEATIGVTVFPRVPTNGRASIIGRQFANVGSYVLKPGTEEPVLRGGVGELCVSGRLVGKGYLNREDLTSEKFPTLQVFRDRVYRTGDLVRVLHDGCFDFLGRADDQVKLRGQRLETGEINHCIRKGVDTVRDVATLVVRNEAQQKDLLVSFIVSDGDSQQGKQGKKLEVIEGSEAADLCRRARDACRSKLPGYMVPTYLLQLPFIPLSANNKAEIKELRKLLASFGQDKLMSLSSSTNKTRGRLNTVGARIAKVLGTMQGMGMSSITPESSIFELGVDSISVLRFSRALKKEGFAQASPSLILQHTLIGDLADVLELHDPISNHASVAAAKQLVQACAHKHRRLVCRELGVLPDQVEYIAPCSPLQQGIISRSTTESAYFNTFRLALSPDISTEHLHGAWQRTVDGLPILRSKFVGTTDGFVQVAIKRAPLPWIEISVDSETSIEDIVRHTHDAWIARNKGGLSQPLNCVHVTSGGDHLLFLHVFHGLYDANSFKLILDRAATEYLHLSGQDCQESGLTAGPPFLEALCHGPLQDFNSSKSFWIKHLDSASLRPVSSAASNSTVATSQRGVFFKSLEATRTSLGVTHQALVQAAWVSVLANHLSADRTIGIIVSGRNIELDGAESVVGPLFNTLPFHAQITAKGQLTWSSLVRQCHDFNTAILPFQHVPLRDIQKWCSGGKPLFDTLFSFQRDEGTTAMQETLWTVVYSEPTADYPLALEATLGLDGDLRLLLVAQQSILDSADCLTRMMDGIEQALASISNDPNGLVSSKGTMPADGLGARPTSTGHPADTLTNGVSDLNAAFTWTEAAVTVRNEIAALADVHPGSVDETTPLFGLGLDSIDVIKLSARLKRQGLGIKTSELIRAQTIRAIVQLLQTNSLSGGRDSSRERKISEVSSALREHLGPYKFVDGEVVLPTTPLQESMVAEMIESDFRLYFNHDILELAPSMDIGKLKEAWTTVVAGSPVLRTRFVPVEDSSVTSSYCQVVGQSSSVYMADISLGSTDEMPTVCEAATLRAREGAGRSYLLQLAFVSVGSQRFLVLSVAHALYDGWSLNLVHRDVQAAYEGRYQARSHEAYVSGIHGIVFAQRDDASAFWAGFLQGATPTMVQESQAVEGLPVGPSTPVSQAPTNPVPDVTDSHLPDVSSPHMDGLPIETMPNTPSNASSQPESSIATQSSSEALGVGEEYLRQEHVVYREEITSSLPLSEITAFCKAHAITMQTLGQSCWAALLAAKTGSLDVTFGVVLSCRDPEVLEELIFPTMNTVAIRSVLHDNISTWLRYMQDNMSSIVAHQHFPLREAQRLAQCYGPLFNTLFLQQRKPPLQDQQESEALMRSIGGEADVEYPVCVEMEMTENALVWRIACEAAYASHAEASRMLRELDQVLGYVIRSPEAQVVAFSGQEVSICGLGPVPLKSVEDTATATLSALVGTEDEVWSPEEETIRDVLSEVSGVSAATILKSNTIYHLGLDSISAIKAGSVLRKRGITVGFRDMLKAGSITEMALLVRKVQQSPQNSPETNGLTGSSNGFSLPADIDHLFILSSIGLDEPNVEDVLPASSMQVHMLSVWQNTRGHVFYPCFTYALSGQVDISIIVRAWQALVYEIPILRTVFVSTDSRSTPILQVVLRPAALDQTIPPPENNTWLSRTAGELSQPYNCLRANKDGGRWLLRLKIHHALYDAVSLPAIMHRFAAICSSNTAPNPGSQTAFNWRAVLAPTLTDDSRSKKKQFWTDYLSDIDPSSTPCFPRFPPCDQGPSSASRVGLINRSALKDISALTKQCKANGISLQALFLAAYAHFLASSTSTPTSTSTTNSVKNSKDAPRRTVVFGIYLANRTEAQDMSTTITLNPGATPATYPFLRLVPLRVVLKGEGLASLFEVAGKIQRDIHAISAPGVVEVGLWEEIAGNLVRDAFPDAVDVEVSVHGDDMTIGVFASGEMLGRDGAAGVIEGVVEVLTGVL
ncbi:hypothetical protein N658DRAFT_488983 [Parathielavia hyrcaniae]|uniref:Carrier domain-containing protein n=1 Tax=Parathielavia hyrcaniae TaxID=113614 RepID=A0AAN6PV96_9PEZI|nr:hypothetical protein N658DRAFT_488983 [Parathielavia hyrcaniae]